MAEVKINPIASAIHYKDSATYWENRAHILQDEVIQLRIALEDRDKKLADLDIELKALEEKDDMK